MATSSASLAKELGDSKARAFGTGSTFARLQKTLAQYERVASSDDPKDMARKETLLQSLGRLSSKYINEHQNAASEQDRARLALARNVADEVPMDLVAITKERSDAKYMDNAVNQFSEGGFKAMDAEARYAAADSQDEYKKQLHAAKTFKNRHDTERLEKRMALIKDRGLSHAEDAAISSYSLGEFKYMNAATANKRTWMDEVKAGKYGQGRGWGRMSNQTLREEGSLHTAMAVRGMAKLEPYEGLTYRGEERWEYEMRKKLVKGKDYEFTNLTSTSKMKETALGFAGAGDKGKVSVVWVITNGGGRDISLLSRTSGEDEVLLLAGTKVLIKAAIRIDEQGQPDDDDIDFPDILESMKKMAKVNGKKYMLVHAHGYSKPDAKRDIDVKSSSGDSMKFERRPG